MDIIPFDPAHARDMDLRPMDAETVAGLGIAPMEMGAALAARGPAFTGIHRGQVAACGGLAVLWPGTAEAWALTGPQVTRLALSFHRAATAMLPTLQEDLGLARVQATVLEDNGPGLRWLERLGFVRETTAPMRAYVAGRGYHLYARIRS